MMAPPKGRRTKQQLDEELKYHIANDWADFRRYTPKKEIVLHEAVLRFSEGPFWGMPVPSAPIWYLDFLCCGGENFLLWKDEALSTELYRMGYCKVDVPSVQAQIVSPVASLRQPQTTLPGPPKTTPDIVAQTDRELMPPPPLPRFTTRGLDYSVLASIARDPADQRYLLTADDAIEAAAAGPALSLQSEIDRGRSYDAAMKRRLYGFRNGVNETFGQRT